MSYFGVSNPELNNPLSGTGAARRGRARAQRRRLTHTQMAGRNGGFSDPREIMAYHNKGELSDGATIQALSLFGIGAAGARRMVNDSHKARQQAAIMGARRQQAAFRSMGNGAGNGGGQGGSQVKHMVIEDSRGGHWRIEYNLDSKYGSAETYKYTPRSLDNGVVLPTRSVTYTAVGGNYPDEPAVKNLIQNKALFDIESHLSTIPIDNEDDEVIVNGDSDAFEGGDSDGDGGDATGDGLPGMVPPNAVEYFGHYYEVVEMPADGKWTFAVYSPEGQLLVVTSGYPAMNWASPAARAWIDSEVAGANPPRGNQVFEESTTETFTFQHVEVPDMPSTWTIVLEKHVGGPPLYPTNYTYTASSSQWEFGLSSGPLEIFPNVASARASAEEKIHNSIMQSIANNAQNDQNGTQIDQNGSEITVTDGYDNDTDVIDGYKMGVIGYREALNTLVLQFNYSENEATEALKTEASSNEWLLDTDGDSFRETGVDNTQTVQIQEEDVVPVPSGPSFIEENKVALAGGAILVAGAAAMAYSNRRN